MKPPGQRLRAVTRALRREIRVDGARATLTLVRTMPCSPERLWPWLTEPARVGRWSAAPLELSGPFAAGTDRIVQLRLGPLPLYRLEETLTSVDPGRSFAYHGRSVRDHTGRVQLDALAGGTRLTWTAAFRAPAALCVLPMAAFVHVQLSASLDELARLV